jgi:hypothetical protein
MPWSKIHHHVKILQVPTSGPISTESDNKQNLTKHKDTDPNQSLNLRLQPIAEIAPAIQALTESNYSSTKSNHPYRQVGGQNHWRLALH